MLVLVTGGSGSGKSEFAERLAMEYGGDMVYIATMKPYDEECVRRIERHRKMREGRGFRTVECYGSLAGAKINADTILLECMSNLTANVMFSGEYDDVFGEVMSGISALEYKNLVIVTNEIASDGIEYDRDTKKYIKILGKLNCFIANTADEVYEVVYGIPVKIKQEGH